MRLIAGATRSGLKAVSGEKDNFDALKFKVAYEDLPAAERQPLMEKVRKELERYPKWYKAERDETEKDGRSQG